MTNSQDLIQGDDDDDDDEDDDDDDEEEEEEEDVDVWPIKGSSDAWTVMWSLQPAVSVMNTVVSEIESQVQGQLFSMSSAGYYRHCFVGPQRTLIILTTVWYSFIIIFSFINNNNNNDNNNNINCQHS